MQKFENFAVRVLYFFNVADSFIPVSVLAFLLYGQLFLSAEPLSFLHLVFFCFLWGCFKIAEFHVLYFVSFPVLLPLILLSPGPAFHGAGAMLLFFLCFTAIIQFVFMGIPNSVAARNPWVPFRMLLNSFAIIAPTTISLPVTLGYQFYMATALDALARPSLSPAIIATSAALLICAVVVRRKRKYCFVPPVRHPDSAGKKVNRVFLLNLDGVSRYAFRKADAPFLHSLESRFLFAPEGAATVYKAFTNPAFASILTGTEPKIHGVTDNNFGQSIKVEGLPDIMQARLYGSMHVAHFSKPAWHTDIVSLVTNRYDRADAVMTERLKKDILAFPAVELWVVDYSTADYCGHSWGAYSGRYYRAITLIDGLIHDLMQWCSKQGILEDSLFIIGSDHGMFIGEHAYLISPKEEFVPLMFVGKNVPQGELKEKASILDISANVSYALGKPYCAKSGGRVFEEVFKYQGNARLAERMGFVQD